MPYPYYSQNNLYGASYSPAYNVPAVPAPAPAAPASGLIWVQGENGAKSYIVPANSTALLMDSEAQRFYIKSVDGSGMPQPLRIYEYTEITAKQDSVPAAEYVTKAEFDKAIAELRKAGRDE